MISAKLKFIEKSFFIELRIFEWYKNIDFKNVSISGYKTECEKKENLFDIKKTPEEDKSCINEF